MELEVDKAKQVEEKNEMKNIPVKEQAIFGFNHPRYADMRLRLIVSENDPPATATSEISESRGNLP
mgnify:CR=1 FL=1